MAETQAREQRAQEESPGKLKLFAGTAHPSLAAQLAVELAVNLGALVVSQFSDGEIRILLEESVRGDDVFILQPTCNPTNDNAMELFIMLDAFRRASARRITVVMPYYGYARQDKKIKPREPITARLIANILEGAGADRVLAVDLHSLQIQGFFNIPVDHLYGGPILGRYFLDRGWADGDNLVVVSPDVAGVGRAKALADMLRAPFAVIAKRRPEPNRVEILEIVGEFEGKRCVMIDDMIDTGRSIVAGAEELMRRGAAQVVACCTHPVFSKNARERLQTSSISEVITLDTLPVEGGPDFSKLTILPVAPLLADAIRRIHGDRSVSELFRNWS